MNSFSLLLATASFGGGALESALNWFATYFVHSTVLLLAALVADRWLQARPQLASAVWKTALLGGVVTATLQVQGVVEPLGGRLDQSP